MSESTLRTWWATPLVGLAGGYLASLVGWQMASLPGAAISLIGICGPSSILSFYVARLWQRFRDYKLCHAIQRGFAPLSIGLVLGGAWLLAGIANTGWSAWLLCAVSALIAWRTSLHPLWLLGAGAVGCAVGGWVALRWQMASGLGMTTLILAALTA